MVLGNVLVLIGPQGSGKGTQAEILAKRHGYMVITMSELLRREIEQQTVQGKAIDDIVRAGKLVPDEYVVALVKGYMDSCQTNANIIFDGFPRTIEQAEALEGFVKVSKVVHIALSREESVKRIAGRVMCPQGHNFNIYYVPPKNAGLCDFDGLPLAARPDDMADVVTERLKLYDQLTSPLLRYYEKRGMLVTIDGDATVEEVAKAIEDKVLAQL